MKIFIYLINLQRKTKHTISASSILLLHFWQNIIQTSGITSNIANLYCLALVFLIRTVLVWVSVINFFKEPTVIYPIPFVFAKSRLKSPFVTNPITSLEHECLITVASGTQSCLISCEYFFNISVSMDTFCNNNEFFLIITDYCTKRPNSKLHPEPLLSELTSEFVKLKAVHKDSRLIYVQIVKPKFTSMRFRPSSIIKTTINLNRWAS